MNVKNMENINVYNYSESTVVLSIRDAQYTIAPAVDGVPSMLPLTFKEIEYINGSSSIIKNGGVRFAEDMQDAMYEALRIHNWNDILFEEVIEDIILHPSLEKLQRIIDVRSIAVIERVKGVLTRLKNDPDTGHRISTRVDKLINRRYSEVTHNKITSDITLSPKDDTIPTVEDINEVKNQNVAMTKELEEMRSMLNKLMEDKAAVKPVIEIPGVVATEAKAEDKPKKRGRPPKSGA